MECLRSGTNLMQVWLSHRFMATRIKVLDCLSIMKSKNKSISYTLQATNHYLSRSCYLYWVIIYCCWNTTKFYLISTTYIYVIMGWRWPRYATELTTYRLRTSQHVTTDNRSRLTLQRGCEFLNLKPYSAFKTDMSLYSCEDRRPRKCS
jgi:hypothetical protein